MTVAENFYFRRYKKRYEESASAGFSNVLYTAAPQQTQVKQTNLYMSEPDSDLDDEPPQYTEIDDICEPPPYTEATATGSNIYADVADIKKVKFDMSDEGVSSEHEELMVELPPPRCGMPVAPEVQPSVLRQGPPRQDLDVSEAFSNNLYGIE